MKNLTYMLAGVSGVVMVLMTASWAQNPPPAANTRAVATVAPAVTAPVAAPVAVQAAPATAPAVSAPPSGTMSTEETVAEMKKSIETGFADNLTFPLTEDKMLAFVRAAIKVEKVNGKWDVQIASAETDQMAIEYNNFAVEEINTTLQNLDGITFPEYQELTKFTVDNKNFNRLYLAYKQLVQEKYFTPPAVKPVAVTVPATVPVVPAAKPPGTVITPPAAPSNPGTVPAPQGSPVPPYSPQQSR